MLRIDEQTGLGVALATDGNGRYCQLDPYAGAQLALAEAYRNVAATGATPLAVTNCLNFGSPEDPGVMWQFAEAVRGLADACVALGVPVTGGNVSFYNQTGAVAIHPTPVVGGARRASTTWPGGCRSGSPPPAPAIVLLGRTARRVRRLGWAHVAHRHLGGLPPRWTWPPSGRWPAAHRRRRKPGCWTRARSVRRGPGCRAGRVLPVRRAGLPGELAG